MLRKESKGFFICSRDGKEGLSCPRPAAGGIRLL